MRKVGRPASRVLGDIEPVLDSEPSGCAGHELHQSARSFWGYSRGVPSRLNIDHRADQFSLYTVAIRPKIRPPARDLAGILSAECMRQNEKRRVELLHTITSGRSAA